MREPPARIELAAFGVQNRCSAKLSLGGVEPGTGTTRLSQSVGGTGMERMTSLELAAFRVET